MTGEQVRVAAMHFADRLTALTQERGPVCAGIDPRADALPAGSALLIVPGYISEPTLPKSWAKLGYAAVGVAPRGKLRSNAQYNPGYPGLLVDNIIDRNTYSYRGFYIDASRAVTSSTTSTCTSGYLAAKCFSTSGRR